MDFGLLDKVAFVAGASSGLGRASAGALAREGCFVAMCSRDSSRIDRAAEEIGSKEGLGEERFLPIACDVTEEEEIEGAIEETVERFGRLNILVTNAGGPPSGRIGTFESSDWRDALELNLMSTINLCRSARPHLEEAARDTAHGRIVMISSVSAKQPIPTLPLSNTSRAGVQGFAKSLAEELGETGITVNTLLPGYTKTTRLDELARKIEEREGKSRESIEGAWAAQNALKRLGTPEEFGATLTFLASRQAGYITGVALPVDGGRSKHLL